MQSPIIASVDSQITRDWEELSLARLANEQAHDVKLQAIQEALDTNDVASLTLLARNAEGLQNVPLRAKAWAMLIGSNLSTSQDQTLLQTLDFNDLEPHKDEDQVSLDIQRLFTLLTRLNSFSHEGNFSYTTILTQEEIETMRKRLFCLIIKILRKYPCLNYYQGLHDVASVVLIVCSDLNDHDEQAFALLESLALYHLRDFMNPHMGLSINHLKLVPLILENVDAAMFQLIRQTSTSYQTTYGGFYDYKFYPALLATLTMYSHDLMNFNHVMLIWDFIFSYGSISVSAYIYVSFITHFRTKILEQLCVSELSELTNVEADLVHNVLSPSALFSSVTDSDIVEILENATRLIENWPLDTLFSSNELSHLWFKEFNTDSVVVTSSKLAWKDAYKHKDLNPSELKSLVDLQEKQQCRESSKELDLFQKATEQDSLATSINSLDGETTTLLSLSLLSNSLSNLSAVSSSINTRISYTSSVILRKVSIQSDDGKKGAFKLDSSSSLRYNVYRISLTIGLIGFILHFLLKHSDISHGYSFRSFHSIIRRTGTILNSESIWRNSVFSHASRAAGHVASSIKNFDFSSFGSYVQEIGLGSARKYFFY